MTPPRDTRIIVNACLTGMIPMKDKAPHVPITPDEIIADALAVHRLGASVVHLHARGLDGTPTWDPAPYREIIQGLRAEAPDLIVCATTSGRLWNEREKRAAVLMIESDFRPDMASLTLGSLNFPKSVSANSIADIDYLLDAMAAQGVKPEFEAFDLGMVDYLVHLAAKERYQQPGYINILLGNLGSAAALPSHMAYLVQHLPPGTVWAGCGIGRAQHPMTCLAVDMGGHVRIGLEDNLYLDFTTREPASNPALVQRIVAFAAERGRACMPAEDVRRMLGLPLRRAVAGR